MGFRALYMGTAEIACASLKALHELPDCEVVGVITQPDRPKGREMKAHFSPVKKYAIELELPVLQPQTLRNNETLGQLRSFHPDLFVVAAFGQILPQAILDLPKHGAVNIHASILPRHRGAAPIQWAILEGDEETGATLMKMDAGLDTGEIIAVSRTRIFETDNSRILRDRLADIGASLITNSLPYYISGKIMPKQQNESLATYARKIVKNDGKIDWSLPSTDIYRRIRAFTPWPGAFTYLPIRQRNLLKIHEATTSELSGSAGEIISITENTLVVACGNGSLDLTEIQREGSRVMDVKNFLNGCTLKPGMILGEA
tara:strand:- start:386 stop:1333 length:948 start_codon:yes stop_codon:yes gene_type:complete